MGTAHFHPPNLASLCARAHTLAPSFPRDVSPHKVDPRFISFVIDTASLKLNPGRPGGDQPSYPYPLDFTSPLLAGFARALSPSYFVMNSGVNNCISYDGFAGGGDRGGGGGNRSSRYESAYCEKKGYYGSLTPARFDEVLGFAAAANVTFVWHLNMAFGRGYAPAYVPWDPEPAAGLLRHAAGRHPLGGVMLFEEVKPQKLGFAINSTEMAADLSMMRAAVKAAGGPMPLVYGVLDQDSDQAPAFTDAAYAASAAEVDVVCYSYYMNNAAGPAPCPVSPEETAAFLIDPANRATIDATTQHYVELSAKLGKAKPHLTAGAACTHAPEGTGWGAVNAQAGAIWYADALGRTARAGIGVFARQTLFGGDYGLLDNSTYLPTPGYWVAVLHKRLMGRDVVQVDVSSAPTPVSANLSVYAHCGAGQYEGGVMLMLVNFGADTAVVQPPDGCGSERVRRCHFACLPL